MYTVCRLHCSPVTFIENAVEVTVLQLMSKFLKKIQQ